MRISIPAQVSAHLLLLLWLLWLLLLVLLHPSMLLLLLLRSLQASCPQEVSFSVRVAPSSHRHGCCFCCDLREAGAAAAAAAAAAGVSLQKTPVGLLAWISLGGRK